MNVFFIFNNRTGDNMKKKMLIIGTFITIIILFIFIKDRIENRTFYDFKSLIKDEFSYVHNISLINYGPHCTIFVYLKKENFDFDKIEPVFIKMMLEISKPSNFNYFERRHCGGREGELPYMDISFREKGVDDEELCKFNSSKTDNFEKWELEDKNEYYYVQDYINE